jgi:hypothetical protein
MLLVDILSCGGLLKSSVLFWVLGVLGRLDEKRTCVRGGLVGVAWNCFGIVCEGLYGFGGCW